MTSKSANSKILIARLIIVKTKILCLKNGINEVKSMHVNMLIIIIIRLDIVKMGRRYNFAETIKYNDLNSKIKINII